MDDKTKISVSSIKILNDFEMKESLIEDYFMIIIQIIIALCLYYMIRNDLWKYTRI